MEVPGYTYFVPFRTDDAAKLYMRDAVKSSTNSAEVTAWDHKESIIHDGIVLI